MADSTVKVIFLGDSKDLRRAMDDVDDASGKMSTSFGRVRDTALGVFSANAIQNGVQSLARGLMSASAAAREDEAAQAQLRQALQNATGATDDQVDSVEKWITRTQNATGVLDDELRPALGTLVRATGDVGKAQGLMSLAMDISQATGKDLQSVSLALAKAHEGNVGGLQRLGISLKGANGETMEFADAQAELAELFGGAVATNLQTTEGRLGLLNARMANLQEEVGARVNVAILAFADFMQQRVVPAIQVVVEWVRDHWPEIRDTIEQVMTRVREVIETVLGAIQAFWRTFGDEVMLVVRTVFDYIRAYIESAMKIIQGIINVIMGLIHGDFSQVWEGIKQIFDGALQYLRAVVELALGLMQAAISAGMTVIAGIFDQMWEAIKNAFSAALNGYVNLLRLFYIELPQKIAGAAVDAGRKLVEALMSGLDTLWDRLVQYTAQLIVSLWGMAWEAGKAAADIGIAIVNSIIDSVGDLGSKIWERIKDSISSLASRVKSALTFDIPGIDIPGFAGGGYPTGLAVVGENGPELAYFNPGSKVWNSGETQRILSGARTGNDSMLSGGGGNVFNVYIGKVNAESPGSAQMWAHTVGRELAVALRGSVN